MNEQDPLHGCDCCADIETCCRTICVLLLIENPDGLVRKRLTVRTLNNDRTFYKWYSMFVKVALNVGVIFASACYY